MRPDLLELASGLAARGEGFALATVVRREPPSSARVGDTALVTAAGGVHGWVGGGCTRSTLLREALRAIADGEPRLLSLSPDPSREVRPGVAALPMTCKSGGSVDIYVEPVLPLPRLVLFGTAAAAHAGPHRARDGLPRRYRRSGGRPRCVPRSRACAGGVAARRHSAGSLCARGYAGCANAVVDALRHLGLTHIDIPITPEKVWQVLHAKGVAE